MGTLHVVATPIGNLEDLSPRARRVLLESPVVVAEDSRHSGRLLTGIGGRPRYISLPGEHEVERIELVLQALQVGDVALISDAGMPAISDPGRRVVDAARTSGFTVLCVPGPSAVVAAVAASGLRADRFLFLGFLPRARGRLLRLLPEDPTVAVVFYESPRRLAKTLEWIAEALGERRVAVGREISKLHESWYRGTGSELALTFREHPPRGECTVVVEASPRSGVRALRNA
ncbi:MAG: 16S rRNA (cytidine(1402)-2'-O)-methyltransferase [Candidatus Dormibacteraeota bacterium]|nr:16S rRNA (cytidine(1402)-2'-O)-methyltransferase [Candidatus Dormibacteraeota bacterium]